MKLCPSCNTFQYARNKKCENCGHDLAGTEVFKVKRSPTRKTTIITALMAIITYVSLFFLIKQSANGVTTSHFIIFAIYTALFISTIVVLQVMGNRAEKHKYIFPYIFVSCLFSLVGILIMAIQFKIYGFISQVVLFSYSQFQLKKEGVFPSWHSRR